VAAVFAFLWQLQKQPEKYWSSLSRYTKVTARINNGDSATRCIVRFSIFYCFCNYFFAASSEMVLVLMICAEQAAVIAVVIIKNKKILFMFLIECDFLNC